MICFDSKSVSLGRSTLEPLDELETASDAAGLIKGQDL